MGKAVKGIVMEITGDTAILMTGSGEFVKVKKPSSNISAGDEIIAKTINTGINLKYAAAAAIIMLMLIPFIYLQQAMATVAYVNVDINPSLEMGINKYNKVSDVKPFNDDAKKITESLSLKGMEIDAALSKVIETAADMGYMDDNKDNTIEIALINLSPGNVNVNEETLIKCAKSAAEQLNIDTKIKVNSAGSKEHKEASKKNISTNKYLDETENKPALETYVKKRPGNENIHRNNSEKYNNRQNKDTRQMNGQKTAPMPGNNYSNNGEQNKKSKEIHSGNENGNGQNNKFQKPKENSNQNSSTKDKSENEHKGSSSNSQKNKK